MFRQRKPLKDIEEGDLIQLKGFRHCLWCHLKQKPLFHVSFISSNTNLKFTASVYHTSDHQLDSGVTQYIYKHGLMAVKHPKFRSMWLWPHWALLQYFWSYMIAVEDKTAYLTVLCTNLTKCVFLYTMHLFHGGHMHFKKKVICIIFILVYWLKSWHKEYYFQVQASTHFTGENHLSRHFIHRPGHQYFNNS